MILEQVEMIGEGAMTFSVFEWLREEAEQLISTLPELILQSAKAQNGHNHESVADNEPKQKKEKKEQLTKAQKRRITDRTNFKGERGNGDGIGLILSDI